MADFDVQLTKKFSKMSIEEATNSYKSDLKKVDRDFVNILLIQGINNVSLVSN